MKNTLIVLGVIILIIIGYFLFASEPTPEVNLEEEEQVEEVEEVQQSQTVEGTVISINRDQVAADGPTVLIVEEDSGDTATITVPSMGLPFCVAQENIADVFALEEGQRVEVRGNVDSEGAITPCESEDHYLRVTE